MKPLRIVLLVACLVIAGLLAVAALASRNGATEFIRFGWSAPAVPALITVPLPTDIRADEVVAVSLPGLRQPAGFELSTAPARLQLHLLPEPGEELTFAAVDLRLDSGRQRRFEFGSASVVPVEKEAGPLTFERALSVSPGGLYQAVALRNGGQRQLTLTATDYLPPQLEEGRLLVARGEPDLLLSRLEELATPAVRRESRAGGFPLPEGFGWRDADDLDLLLAPREAVVLAWTDGALPALAGDVSFELRPVVEYRVAVSDGGGLVGRGTLGLQVAVRREP